MNNAILLISCPDQKGITAKVTDFIFANNGNIEHADQHIDKEANTFFMRVEWALSGFGIPGNKIAESFLPTAKRFGMDWNLYFTRDIPRIAIFVSHLTHSLYDLLLRHKDGQLRCVIPLIISNHPDAKKIADEFGIKFCLVPKNSRNKREAEARELALLKKYRIELIALARYMQVFTRHFILGFPGMIINIHHSFLPAFAGADPYRQAFKRGVKIIGATSHYATEALDAGPIIEQDTVRVSHRDDLGDLIVKGRDLEKAVLSRALRWHLERKILVYNNKTVVFD